MYVFAFVVISLSLSQNSWGSKKWRMKAHIRLPVANKIEFRTKRVGVNKFSSGLDVMKWLSLVHSGNLERRLSGLLAICAPKTQECDLLQRL